MGRPTVPFLLAGLAAALVLESAWAEDAGLPDISGTPLALTDTVFPPGGAVLRTAGSWHVYGDLEGVQYRYAEDDPTTIFVANRKGLSRFQLTKEVAWSMTCFEAPNHALNCSIQSPPMREILERSVATIGDNVCLMSPGRIIPEPPSVHAQDGRTCVAVEESERILSDLNAGRATLGGVSGFGYPQARALRDWIIEKYKSGDLGAQ